MPQPGSPPEKAASASAAAAAAAAATPDDAPLTDAQTAALAALRQAASAELSALPAADAYWSTDGALTRFLVARRWSVDKAAAQLRAALAWRRAPAGEAAPGVPACELLARFVEPTVLRRYFSWGLVGLDREGYGVLVERVGRVDLLGVHDAVGTPRFLAWVAYYHELQERAMRAVSAAQGRARHKLTVIIDLAGLTLRHASTHTLAVLRQRTRLEEDNYPEVVKRVLIINAPALFTATWTYVRHFLDEGTAAKFSICGADFLPTLLKYIEPAAIPVSLGGELKDASGSPDCCLLVGPGGHVPAAVMLGVAEDGLGDGEELTLAAGAATDVTLRLPAGARAFWRWASADKDVAFSAVAGAAAPAEGPAAPLAPAASVCGVHMLAPNYAELPPDAPPRAPSHAPHADTKAAPAPGEVSVVAAARAHRGDGEFTATADGTVLRLRWDNATSWMTSKHLVRRVDVLLPGDGASRADAIAAGRMRVETEPGLRLDGYAKARMENMATFGSPASTCWQTSSAAKLAVEPKKL